MISDARIRLEGRLEQIERATAVLESTLPSIRRGAVDVAQRVLDETSTPEVWAAVRRARELSDEEPELKPILAKLDRVKVKLADTVHALARARGVPPSSVRREVEKLLEAPVVYESRLFNHAAFFVVPIAGTWLLFVITAMVTQDAWGPLPMFAGFGILMLWSVARTTKVVVTQEALVVNGAVTPVSTIERVSFESTCSRQTRYRMVVRLHHGSLSYELPTSPGDLLRALTRVGVAVEQRGSWWW